MSVLGTIQPGPLGTYLGEALRGGTGNDGLMQRFQLAVWPDDPGRWLRAETLNTPGRPKVIHHINPKLAAPTP